MKRRLATVAAALALALSAAGPLTGTAAGAARADAIRDLEWGVDGVRAPQAWGVTQGRGVTVAVLDTGVDAQHPDLTGQVLGGRDLIGFGAGRGDGEWARHGTAMAGIIAAHGHGPGGGDGVRGVAPAARILPVRVILEEADPSRKRARAKRGGALAEGIRWAADHGADVINLSLGDDSKTAHPEAGEDAAVQYALAKGVVVVASAGNSGAKGNRASYPAAYPGVIAVTAVDRDGDRAPFSTRRWYATVAAPGVDVVIADPDRNYYEGWGTSAAAAFVSGVAALVRSANPDLSPRQVKQLLQQTARRTPEGGRSDALGAGVVDAGAAVRLALKTKPQPQRPSTAPAKERYFGPGPTTAGPPGPPAPGGRELGLGVAGLGLLGAAYFAWRRSREPYAEALPWPDEARPAPARPPATEAPEAAAAPQAPRPVRPAHPAGLPSTRGADESS
ncbi:type VII secretion-associated serine protease mycosin [Streptomyces polyrhachis]|uniref:Type VII secretion-associated serine protease mycosin n=1 Tax=Streptomyces polyrhachis TaxID=1282885 RepID=A0ABW2GBB5_9ACTN